MKKNILFVVDEQKYGGISAVLTSILKKIDKDKYNIDLLILHNRGQALSSIPDNVNLIYGTNYFKAIDYTLSNAIKTKNISLIFYKIKTVIGLKTGEIRKTIEKERKKILKKKYDVEIAFKDGFCALFTAFGDSSKKISWLHISYDIYDCTSRYRELFKEVYSKIDKIVAITPDVSKTFNDIYEKQDKTEIIENLIIPEEIIEKSKEKIEDFDKSKVNLISVGRIVQMKAYPRLVKQMVKLQNEGLLKDVVLYIVGDGEEEEKINKIIKENKLENNVKLLGYKENPYPYIAQADMLLLSSYYEGLGLVLIEANILGVPCFATRFANVDNTLDNGKYGLVVENSESGIYNGLKSILENKETINNYKQNLLNYKYKKDNEILDKIYKLID